MSRVVDTNIGSSIKQIPQSLCNPMIQQMYESIKQTMDILPLITEQYDSFHTQFYNQFLKIASSIFVEMKDVTFAAISGRPLFVMFEKILKCDPKRDHESPKDVLPIYEPLLNKSYNLVSRQILNQIFDSFNELRSQFREMLANTFHQQLYQNFEAYLEVIRTQIDIQATDKQITDISKRMGNRQIQFIDQMNTLKKQMAEGIKIKIYRGDSGLEQEKAQVEVQIDPKVINLRAQIDVISRQLKTSTADLDKANKQISQLLKDNQNLVSRLSIIDRLQTQNNELLSQIDDLEQQKSQCEMLIQQQKDELESLRPTLQKYEICSQKQQYSYMSSINDITLEFCQQLPSKDNREMSTQVAFIDASLFESMKAHLDTDENNYNLMQQQSNQNRKLLLQAQNELQTQKDEYDNLRKLFNQLQQQYEDQKQQLTLQQSELQKLKELQRNVKHTITMPVSRPQDQNQITISAEELAMLKKAQQDCEELSKKNYALEMAAAKTQIDGYQFAVDIVHIGIQVGSEDSIIERTIFDPEAMVKAKMNFIFKDGDFIAECESLSTQNKSFLFKGRNSKGLQTIEHRNNAIDLQKLVVNRNHTQLYDQNGYEMKPMTSIEIEQFNSKSSVLDDQSKANLLFNTQGDQVEQQINSVLGFQGKKDNMSMNNQDTVHINANQVNVNQDNNVQQKQRICSEAQVQNKRFENVDFSKLDVVQFQYSFREGSIDAKCEHAKFNHLSYIFRGLVKQGQHQVLTVDNNYDIANNLCYAYIQESCIIDFNGNVIFPEVLKEQQQGEMTDQHLQLFSKNISQRSQNNSETEILANTNETDNTLNKKYSLDSRSQMQQPLERVLLGDSKDPAIAGRLEQNKIKINDKESFIAKQQQLSQRVEQIEIKRQAQLQSEGGRRKQLFNLYDRALMNPMLRKAMKEYDQDYFNQKQQQNPLSKMQSKYQGNTQDTDTMVLYGMTEEETLFAPALMGSVLTGQLPQMSKKQYNQSQYNGGIVGDELMTVSALGKRKQMPPFKQEVFQQKSSKVQAESGLNLRGSILSQTQESSRKMRK